MPSTKACCMLAVLEVPFLYSRYSPRLLIPKSEKHLRISQMLIHSSLDSNFMVAS